MRPRVSSLAFGSAVRGARKKRPAEAHSKTLVSLLMKSGQSAAVTNSLWTQDAAEGTTVQAAPQDDNREGICTHATQARTPTNTNNTRERGARLSVG